MPLCVLHPAGGLTVEEVIGAVRPQELPVGRPYVIANFITTADGSVALGGESGTIARHAPGDRTLFRLLRRQVDAVLAGTSTLAHEGYRRLIREEDVRAAREADGLQPDPLAVVWSRSGQIPDGIPMLEDPDQPTRIFTGEAADPRAALAALRAEDGVEVLLCEGGPTLLGDLIRRDLIDELFLTIAPVLGGGTPERTLLSGTPDRARRLDLRALVKEGGGLHARYAMLAAGEDPSPDLMPGAHQPQ